MDNLSKKLNKHTLGLHFNTLVGNVSISWYHVSFKAFLQSYLSEYSRVTNILNSKVFNSTVENSMTDFSHDNIIDPSLPRACRNVVGVTLWHFQEWAHYSHKDFVYPPHYMAWSHVMPWALRVDIRTVNCWMDAMVMWNWGLKKAGPHLSPHVEAPPDALVPWL